MIPSCAKRNCPLHYIPLHRHSIYKRNTGSEIELNRTDDLIRLGQAQFDAVRLGSAQFDGNTACGTCLEFGTIVQSRTKVGP